MTLFTQRNIPILLLLMVYLHTHKSVLVSQTMITTSSPATIPPKNDIYDAFMSNNYTQHKTDINITHEKIRNEVV